MSQGVEQSHLNAPTICIYINEIIPLLDNTIIFRRYYVKGQNENRSMSFDHRISAVAIWKIRQSSALQKKAHRAVNNMGSSCVMKY